MMTQNIELCRVFADFRKSRTVFDGNFGSFLFGKVGFASWECDCWRLDQVYWELEGVDGDVDGDVC